MPAKTELRRPHEERSIAWHEGLCRGKENEVFARGSKTLGFQLLAEICLVYLLRRFSAAVQSGHLQKPVWSCQIHAVLWT